MRAIAAENGFTISRHVLEFFGLCSDCQKKKKAGKQSKQGEQAQQARQGE